MIILLTICLNLCAPEFHSILIERQEGIWHIDITEISSLLRKHQVKYPQIVLKQVCLETGYLTSDILKANKNLFGMRYAPGRKTTATGEQFGCAIYASIGKSIEDYKIWQDLYYKGGDYYSYLQRIGYATDREYISKLKKIKI